MSLLIPLGLLGLLGLGILILIYILKPNYQQKMISSTYVWKLSMKYRKKRIPISRLRNFLILLCQILIICCAAMILAQPVIVTSSSQTTDEKIIVIDASAGMMAESGGQTRFERAVDGAQQEANEIFAKGGYVTVIWAGPTASSVIQRADKSAQNTFKSLMDSLECSYGGADIDGAMEIAEQLLESNPDAEVVLYTGTEYANQGKNVTVKYLRQEGDWNAAILNATAELVDNVYVFTIDVACYGADEPVEVICELTKVNGTADTAYLQTVTVDTQLDETISVVYSVNGGIDTNSTVYAPLGYSIYSFEEMYIRIETSERDALAGDNEYYIYGAKRPEIKILYYTTSENPFYSMALKTLEQNKDLAPYWDISVKEVKKGVPETEGYDFYLYESTMPETLPKDGVVLMANPTSAADAGFTLGKVTSVKYEGDGAELAPGIEHDLTKYIDVSLIRVTQYTQVDESSLDGYDVLAYYQGYPVFFVKNEADAKVGVITFGTAYSTFNIGFIFPMIIREYYGYYFTPTFETNHYDVYHTVNFTPRGTELEVSYRDEVVLRGDDGEDTLYFSAPGTYTVTQKLISGVYQTEKIYVTIPADQSNVVRKEDSLTYPHVEKVDKFTFDDLLVYFAAAIVALLFLEWLLQTREGM